MTKTTVSKNYGLGCPRCGGSTTRVSGFVVCRKCGYRLGTQSLDAPGEPLDHGYPNDPGDPRGPRRPLTGRDR